MSADAFIQWLFVDHWILATFAMPWLTMFYAAFTNQTLWTIGCCLLSAAYTALRNSE